MKRAKLALSVAAVSLGAGLWAGTAQADITIALAGPMTGPAAAYGEQTRAGVEAAVADINAKGGLLGQKLVLTVTDDACDAKQAVAAANKLVGQNVAAVIGHVCSGATIAASDVYSEEGILMITPTATSPQLTERGLKEVFRVCGRDDQQGEVAAKMIVERFKGKKVAIVHDKQAYGQGLAEDVKRRLNAAGITEAVFTSISAGEKDYSSLVTRLKSDGVDVLYYGGYDQELGLIVRQAADQQFRPQVIGADGIQPVSYWHVAGDAAEGTMFTFSPDPQRNPNAKPVVEALQAKNVRTDGFTLFGYAAVQTFAQGAQKAGSVKSADVAKALRANAFDTVVGTLEFDAKGDLKKPGYVLWAWKAGEKVQLD